MAKVLDPVHSRWVRVGSAILLFVGLPLSLLGFDPNPTWTPSLPPADAIGTLPLNPGSSVSDDSPSGLNEASDTVHYRRDVMQILSKAGCNAGPCHGNANGKGGFKLSLRGEDPTTDWIALTQDQSGRRVQRMQPDQSLLLLKATSRLTHEGGKRFDPDSWEYETLLKWIASGAQNPEQHPPAPVRLEVSPIIHIRTAPMTELSRLQATVHFEDGTHRDVTHQVVYEPINPAVEISGDGRILNAPLGESTILVRYLNLQQPVRFSLIPDRPDFSWTEPLPDHLVDRPIFEKLRTHKLYPAEVCRDEIFLRRIFQDLLGLLPTPEETREFLDETREDKREIWVERLLERPEFADFWALKWADLLRVEERTLDRKGMEAFHRWLRQAMANNVPLTEFAKAILSAQGSTYTHPPANFYRANRTPVDRGLAVAQVFLGTRLNCAECHNHPFDRWTQDDYHDWAAVFARVNYKVLRNDRRDSNDQHEFKGEQVVYLAAEGRVSNPRTGNAAIARFLGETKPVFNEGQSAWDGERSELESLADWLVQQRQFAMVQVNRTWAHLMGRGLVDPVDDFRATNPASHPELLEALTDAFLEHGQDLRFLIRTITGSRTYQMSSEPHPENYPDAIHYSANQPRRLAAEPLLDIQRQVTGVPLNFTGYPAGWRSAQLPGGLSQKRGRKHAVDAFLEVFGKPPRLLTCECERGTDTSIAQVFHLINGPTIHEVVQHPKNLLSQLLARESDPEAVIESLYWTALTRSPSEKELQFARAHWERHADNPRLALEDLLWSLLNAKEFIFRH